MPLPAAILLVAALLTTALAGIGWWQDPAAPEIGPWLVAKASEGGLWSGLLLFLAAVGYFVWRGDRRARGEAGAGGRGGDPEGVN